MAFSATIVKRTVVGDQIMVNGTFANTGGSTGGDIVTGLRKVNAIYLQKTGAAVDASQYAVNETMPADTGSITIVTTADVSGTFTAFGTE